VFSYRTAQGVGTQTDAKDLHLRLYSTKTGLSIPFRSKDLSESPI
jgi:hypothetical protein